MVSDQNDGNNCENNTEGLKEVNYLTILLSESEPVRYFKIQTKKGLYISASPLFL